MVTWLWCGREGPSLGRGRRPHSEWLREQAQALLSPLQQGGHGEGVSCFGVLAVELQPISR